MTTSTKATRIWDLPVRLTHWALVIVLPAMYFTADNSEWGWHLRLGHVLLALLIFRVIWGVIGSDTARFSSFVKGPAAVIAYLRGRYDESAHKGHSPLAALAVIALLALMFAQVGMGLFAGDPFDGATGPLNPLVGVMTASWLTDTHKWFWWAVFAMIGLHLAAISFYWAIKRQNLVSPMIEGTGEKAADVPDNPPASWPKAIGALAVSAAISAWIYLGAPGVG